VFLGQPLVGHNVNVPKRAVPIAIVRGAGDLGTGVAYRLWRCGFACCAWTERPLVIRRSVAFASALYDGRITVDGAQAERIYFADEAVYVWGNNGIPVMVDPEGRAISAIGPDVVVDAILAKTNTGTRMTDAPVVIACGPGFTVGVDCHAVVETQRGHDLGRVLRQGGAQPNTGVPGEIGGESARRVVRAPEAGIVVSRRAIGDQVKAGDLIAEIEVTAAARDGARSGERRPVRHADVRATSMGCCAG
jgi:xanthine dehydrogenase accessory factor